MKTLFNYFVGPASKKKGSKEKQLENYSEGYVIEGVVDIELEVVSEQTNNGFRYAVASAASNDPNEDRTSVLMVPGISVFAVYDGHGGNLACDIATATLAENLIAKVSALGGAGDVRPDSIESVIKKAYQECDDLILREAQEIINSNLITAAANGPTQVNCRRNHDRKRAEKNSDRNKSTCWNGKEYFAVTGKKPERAGSCAVMALFRGKELSLSHVGYVHDLQFKTFVYISLDSLSLQRLSCVPIV